MLLWFRKYQFLFICDIEEMYRQIELHLDDRDLQRIVWSDSLDNIIDYELTTVT